MDSERDTSERETPLDAGIQWIVFDAVGTLIVPDPPVGRTYWQIGRRFGSRLSEDDVTRRFHAAFSDFERRELVQADVTNRHHLQTGERHERHRWQTIVQQVFDDIEDSAGCFDALFAHFGRPAAWHCFPDVSPVLKDLRRKGYKLGIASNFDRRLHGVLNGLSIGGLFELRAVSSEVGYRKPSRHFFAAVEQLAGVPAHRILMVGDDVENDITAARHAGMSAVPIDRTAPDSSADILTHLHPLVERRSMPCPPSG